MPWKTNLSSYRYDIHSERNQDQSFMLRQTENTRINSLNVVLKSSICLDSFLQISNQIHKFVFINCKYSMVFLIEIWMEFD